MAGCKVSTSMGPRSSTQSLGKGAGTGGHLSAQPAAQPGRPAVLISNVEQICSTPPRITKPGLPGTPGSSSPGVLNPLKALIRTACRQFFGLDTLNFLPVHRLTGYVQATWPPGFTCDPPNTQILNPQLPGSHFALSPPAYLFRCARTGWSQQPPARAVLRAPEHTAGTCPAWQGESRRKITST